MSSPDAAPPSREPVCTVCGETQTARGGDVHCSGDCDDFGHGESGGCHHFVPPSEPTLADRLAMCAPSRACVLPMGHNGHCMDYGAGRDRVASQWKRAAVAAALRAASAADLEAQMKAWGIGGIFDEFRSLEDAASQMATYIREATEAAVAINPDYEGTGIAGAFHDMAAELGRLRAASAPEKPDAVLYVAAWGAHEVMASCLHCCNSDALDPLTKALSPYHWKGKTLVRAASAPTNCQHEPSYPGADTVVMSIRDPDMLCHGKRDDCPHEAPHRWSECGAASGLCGPGSCGVCGGSPPASGLPCICGGVGTLHAELEGTRKELFSWEIAAGNFPALNPASSDKHRFFRAASAEPSGEAHKDWLWREAQRLLDSTVDPGDKLYFLSRIVKEALAAAPVSEPQREGGEDA